MGNTPVNGEDSCKQLQTPGHTMLATYSAREGNEVDILSSSPTYTEADGGSVYCLF